MNILRVSLFDLKYQDYTHHINYMSGACAYLSLVINCIIQMRIIRTARSARARAFQFAHQDCSCEFDNMFILIVL